MIKALFIALQLMTRLPTPAIKQAGQQDYGRSVLFYPLVGLVIGGLLFGLWQLLLVVPGLDSKPLLVAVIVLLAWVMITGGLHLDGLADSADAWLGGFGDRQRSLEIMKDPNAGSAAVIAIMLLLLLKLGAVFYLDNHNVIYLLLVPVLARTSVVVLFVTTAYVRKQGIASAHVEGLSRRTAWIVIVLVSLLLVAAFRQAAVLALIATTVLLLLLRYLMIKRLGGMTGDTAGALVEVTEAVVLTLLVIVLQ